MHYDAIENRHGLKHDPFKALIVPRPIGWITSVSQDGLVNLAPYSYFNAVADQPHYLMFSSCGRKDTLCNIEDTGEFTCSIATWESRFQVNTTSAPVRPDVDEYAVAGLTAVRSQYVTPPRVKGAPAALECRYWKTVRLPDVSPDSDQGHFVVFGRVVGVYIDDEFIKDGIVETSRMRPLARMGYMQFAVITPETTVTINRPRMNDDRTVASLTTNTWDGEYR